MEFLSSETKGIALDILEDILSAIERVEERTKDIQTTDDFLCSSSGMVLLDATCMLLIAIGESLKNLDKTTDGKLLPTYPSIPWKNVKGMRDIRIIENNSYLCTKLKNKMSDDISQSVSQ